MERGAGWRWIGERLEDVGEDMAYIHRVVNGKAVTGVERSEHACNCVLNETERRKGAVGAGYGLVIQGFG